MSKKSNQQLEKCKIEKSVRFVGPVTFDNAVIINCSEQHKNIIFESFMNDSNIFSKLRNAFNIDKLIMDLHETRKILGNNIKILNAKIKKSNNTVDIISKIRNVTQDTVDLTNRYEKSEKNNSENFQSIQTQIRSITELLSKMEKSIDQLRIDFKKLENQEVLGNPDDDV